MTPNLRILLLDRNRYVSLLIEREISLQLPTAVISKFTDAKSAIEELAANHYHAALLDYDTILAANDADHSEIFDSFDADLPLILMVSPDYESDAGLRLRAEEIVAKQNGFQKQLPGHIINVVKRREADIAEQLRTPVSGQGESLLQIITSTLSHEINNPLMTILGSAELLLEMQDELDGDTVAKVRMIHESAQRIQSRLSHLANLRQPNLRNSSTGYLITTQK